MSQFKTHTWWEYPGSSEEECDVGCLCVGNLDDSPNGLNKLVTGNFQGVLRIFQIPFEHPPLERTDYIPEHQVHEVRLGKPILQLALGAFTTVSDRLCLAVLHPRSVVVYSFSAIIGVTDKQPVYKQQEEFELKLPRTAFNMCVGQFSSVSKSLECLIVQSMDSEQFFFEHNQLLFSRYIPNMVVPGPMCYISTVQSICIVDSVMKLHCYSYHALANVGSAGAVINSKLTSISSIWSYDLGSACTQVFTSRLDRVRADTKANAPPFSPLEIVAICDAHYVILSTDGIVRRQSRQEVPVVAATAYTVSKHGNTMRDVVTVGSFLETAQFKRGDVDQYDQQLLLTVTTNNTIEIFRDYEQVWGAAQGIELPVQCMIASVGGVRNALVCLNDRCKLSVKYFGTDMPSLGTNRQVEQNQKYEEVSKEYQHQSRQLKKPVKTQDLLHMEVQTSSVATTMGDTLKQGLTGGSIKMNQELSKRVDCITLAHYNDVSLQSPLTVGDTSTSVLTHEGQGAPLHAINKRLWPHNSLYQTCNMVLKLHPNESLRNVSVKFSHSSSVVCSCSGITQDTLEQGDIHEYTIVWRATTHCVAPSSVAYIHYTYIDTQEQVHSGCVTARLPLDQFFRIVPPVKQEAFAVTVVVNREKVPSLNLQLPDLCEIAAYKFPACAQTNHHVITLQSHHFCAHCTIVASKKGPRFRVQASHMSVIPVIQQELTDRLTLFYNTNTTFCSGNEAPLQVRIVERPSPNEVIRLAEIYTNVKKEYLATNLVSANLSKQFMAIEKRFFAKLKEKQTSATIGNMEALLKITQTAIQTSFAKADKLQQQLQYNRACLAATVEAFVTHVEMHFGLSDKSKEVIRSIFPSLGTDESCRCTRSLHNLQSTKIDYNIPIPPPIELAQSEALQGVTYLQQLYEGHMYVLTQVMNKTPAWATMQQEVDANILHKCITLLLDEIESGAKLYVTEKKPKSKKKVDEPTQ